MARDRAKDWARIWQQFAPKSLKRLEVRHTESGGELQFARQELGRRWRFDWAMPSVKVAVEIDGGKRIAKYLPHKRRCVVVGRHNLEGDMEKMNAAAMLGWTVLHFTPQMLKRDPLGCVAIVAETIRRKT